MSLPFWARELAHSFWSAAGDEPFPRDLRLPIARALPLTVCFLPQLRVGGIESWLARAGAPYCAGVADRPLRACLVARNGHGLIFIDGVDAPDEQRFSLAHELAHFLHDYWAPRIRAVTALGPTITEVLDGIRPPRREERVAAILSAVPMTTYVHLMDRDDGAPVGLEGAAERAADLLACELLAPQDSVEEQAGPSAGQQTLATLLRTAYGLPPGPAHRYAATLCPAASPQRRLRLVR